MKSVRVLLVDDHAMVRAGLKSLLEDMADVEIVGEASNGREALALVERLEPDLVLMDAMMPELNGLDAAARLAASHPNVRVIILSMNATEEYVLQALRAGAAGYLIKDNSPAELEQAVRAVARGETYLTSVVAKHVVAGLLDRSNNTTASAKQLSPRQREVLQLIAEGNSTKQIAAKFDVSVKTIESHRQQLMDTLNIHDIAGLVRYAIRIGLVSAE